MSDVLVTVQVSRELRRGVDKVAAFRAGVNRLSQELLGKSEFPVTPYYFADIFAEETDANLEWARKRLNVDKETPIHAALAWSGDSGVMAVYSVFRKRGVVNA